MDVRLSPEQLALRDSVAQAVGRLGPKTVRDLDDGERSAKLDAAVDGAGWRELRTADDDGRPWASGVEVAIVAEELARGLADVAFMGPTLAADLRRCAGAGAGSSAETVTLTGSLGALAVARVAVDSVGSDAVAIDVAGATSALVLMDGGLGSVALGAVGTAVDLTRPSAGLDGTAVAVGGALNEAEIDRWTALGLALTCADLVGTMRGAVQLACDYAVARQQYGAPIGSFQAVQHLLADALVSMEGSRSVALHAAWAVDALSADDALAAAALAKAYCARAARTVCETAIQVHGGIGNTWDCLAHVFLRRSLLSGDILGGAGDGLARVLQHRGIGR
jgi:alkylation response protein AidB-like acyl-CoA dehydrogenase